MLRSTTVVVRRNTQPVTWVFRPMWPSEKQPRFEPWAAEGARVGHEEGCWRPLQLSSWTRYDPVSRDAERLRGAEVIEN